MGRQLHTMVRMYERVSDLENKFPEYCDLSDRSELFTGPSHYFHCKTISRLRQYASPTQALQDEQFLEALYATLAAWGLHRMGRGHTKLVAFDKMVGSLRNHAAQISELAPLRIWTLSGD